MNQACILVGVPIYEGIKAAPYGAQVDMFRYTDAGRREMGYAGWDDVSHVLLTVGPRISIREARNGMVESTLRNEKFTHLLFLDDDIVPPPNLIPELLKVRQPIVGALVNDARGNPVVFAGDQYGESRWMDCPREGVFECWAIGSGAMLIERRVLEAMQKPWFFFERNGRSMDVNFCREARAKGFTVWCNATAQCGQLRHENKVM
jgi:hypothetical protein